VVAGAAGGGGVQAARTRLAINTSVIIQVIFLIFLSFGYLIYWTEKNRFAVS
jgi:uncharacterized membrane protein YtjA (UPF0391 family)